MSAPPVSINRIAVCAGTMAFFYQFENCLTATALPVMCREVENLSGVVSLVPAAYLVAATVAMVPAGRLAARVGFHIMLASALAVMAAGALICWLAPGAEILIAGRCLQGLGGGALASAAYGLVAVCVPAEMRRGVLGWVSLGAGLGMVVGSPLGGVVAQLFSWRTLFLLQIPFLLPVALLILRMKFGNGNTGAVPLGAARSLVLGLGAACACVAGSLGRERGWLSPEILGLQIGAVLVFVFFVMSEQKAVSPLFPREVWREGSFWRSWGLLFACATALGGTFFLVPFYLHEVAGLSVPAASGWMMLLVLGYSLAAMEAGRLQKFMTTEQQALAGSLLTLGGVMLFALGGVKAMGPSGVAVGCTLVGLGFGLMFPAVNAGCVARLPEARRGLGAALLPLGLNLGSVAGVITSAELREWHLGEVASRDYEQAFGVVIIALMVAGAGFWKLGRIQKAFL